MRKINQIVLNEYDETALVDVLESVINKEHSEFMSLCEADGLTFTSRSKAFDAEYLMWKLEPELKNHVCYKAMRVLAELRSALNE